MTEPTWKAELEQNGFVHLPGVLDADDAARLALLSLQSLGDYSDSQDLVRTGDGVPVKLTYPLDKYPDFISVLGSREVRDIVDSLLPADDSVLTWEDILVKPPSVGVEVGVHQDIGLDPTRDTVHSLGISLNGDQDNPVYFLPGSHRLGPLTATAVAALWQDCREQFKPIVTQPGDVVIHNVHVLHYSEPNLSELPRATWYLEFRSMRSLLEKGPWGDDWTQRRRAIWVHARAAAGDNIGDDETDPVKAYLKALDDGEGALRVPHVTETVQYDAASPYNHFSGWNDDWKSSRVTPDGSHHVRAGDGQPLYRARFHEVLKFHAPGLAPVVDESGAYHITADGRAAYPFRYLRAFGFYEGIAAVQSAEGWHHIYPDGAALYGERYAWCGNFQGGRCPVRDAEGRYFHVRADGAPAYAERYRYAGDFRDGHAVVQNDAGEHTHVDADGNPLHGKWFRDLDVFHKGHARAADGQGWHHVDMAGQPLYGVRFRSVEPFYNGQARVERHDGSLAVIDERGQEVLSLRGAASSASPPEERAGGEVLPLRGPTASPLHALSADMVGVWRTQAIRAAVELGVFEALPASAREIEGALELAPAHGARLLRALLELGLVKRDAGGVYHATEKGAYLHTGHALSLAEAAGHWGELSYDAWRGLAGSLRSGAPAFNARHGRNIFDWLEGRPADLAASQRAFAAYARHDYAGLSEVWDFGVHDAILDAGGGSGELAFALLRAYPNLTAAVLDRPEVGERFAAPDDVAERCQFVAGNLFEQWPVQCDAVFLARVLHDWPDDDARRILGRARDAMPAGGSLYVVEMALDEAAGAGGLLDLNMLVMTGGRERTAREFEELLGDAGFRLLDARPTGTVNSLLRATAV